MVPSSALMNDCPVQVVTYIRTDMAAECLLVGMVKKCRKNRHASDSQQIGFWRTVVSNNRFLPSVEVLMCAQPSP